MEEKLENLEESAENTFKARDFIKPAIILAGALFVLMMKGYVSAKLLMGLVLLDYFTTDFIRKLPLPVCIGISIALILTVFFY